MDDQKKKSLINKILLLGLSVPFLFLGGAQNISYADEIILESGTPIAGTIISEDAEEISIITADNMVLHLDKSIVHRVKRTPKNEVKALQPRVVKVPVKSHPSSTPALAATSKVESSTMAVVQPPVPSSPTVAVVAPKPSESPVDGKTWKVGFVSVTEVPATKQVHVDPLQNDLVKILELAQSDYHTTWTGDAKKEAQGFVWKSVQVVSTVTVPHLVKGKRGPLDETTQHEITVQVDNEQKIQNEFLHNLAEAFPSLTGLTDSELHEKTDQFFNDMMSRAEKRRRGLHRLSQKSPKTLPQAPK